MLVLVVEDEPLSAFNLTSALEEAGYSVVGPACSSGEAIVLARGRRPGFALIDIDLESEGAGIRLARQLCAEFDMQIIFMTEHEAPARENAHCAIGMITKPFDAKTVAGILRYADERVRAGSSSSARSCPPSFEPFE